MLKLYDYFRSSASVRVRIALNIKNIKYEKIPINLLENTQRHTDYLSKNPFGLVPSIQTEDNQSLAIIEYLDMTYPEIRLIPNNPTDMAYVKSIAYAIAMDIHPLNNLKVLKYLQQVLHVTDEDKNIWYKHWIETGFAGLEQQLSLSNKVGKYCCGDTLTLADICLIPQVFNANRFKIDLTAYPIIQKINAECLKLEAFSTALPE